jgi:hypothetical protein
MRIFVYGLKLGKEHFKVVELEVVQFALLERI